MPGQKFPQQPPGLRLLAGKLPVLAQGLPQLRQRGKGGLQGRHTSASTAMGSPGRMSPSSSTFTKIPSVGMMHMPTCL